MSIPVTFEILVGVLGGIVVALLVLLVLQARNSVAVTRLSAPAYAYLQEEGKKQAKQLLDKATAEADAIKKEARTERASLLESVERTLTELRQDYAKTLETGVTNELKQFNTDANEQVANIHSQLETLQQELTKTKQAANTTTDTLEAVVKSAQESIEHSTGTALSHFEETLQAAAENAKTRLAEEGEQLQSALQEQQTTARKELEAHMQTYQSAREKMLDEHIVQIVEAVTKDVLHKQLTVTEHADLAVKALQQAKQDNIL